MDFGTSTKGTSSDIQPDISKDVGSVLALPSSVKFLKKHRNNCILNGGPFEGSMREARGGGGGERARRSVAPQSSHSHIASLPSPKAVTCHLSKYFSFSTVFFVSPELCVLQSQY